MSIHKDWHDRIVIQCDKCDKHLTPKKMKTALREQSGKVKHIRGYYITETRGWKMVKINALELENIKRVKAVTLTPTANGLTVIGGANGQGKTSVLDAIAWALGGEKYHPTNANREGSVLPPNLRIELSNGLLVERKGKSGSLKVTDGKGGRGGQKLLDEFISQLALDLPKFLTKNAKEKADVLLTTIGLGDKLAAIDKERQRLYNQRHDVGVVADQKRKYAEEMSYVAGVPEELIDTTELISKHEGELKHNELTEKAKQDYSHKIELEEVAKRAYNAAVKSLQDARLEVEKAKKLADEATTIDTSGFEEKLAEINKKNEQIRGNLAKDKAVQEASALSEQYKALSDELAEADKNRKALLDGANLPLPELSVENGELTYKGKKWDCMAGSEQLKVATAIVQRTNPDCGFVLVDKLEQMDTNTLAEFGAWAEGQGLQVIGTRVSVGGECSVIIEDGYVKGTEKPEAPQEVREEKKFTKGVF